MAGSPDVGPAKPGVVMPRSVFILLLLGTNAVWGDSNTVSSDFRSHNTTGPNIAAIVAPTVTLGLLAIISAVAAWLLCVVKKKRQTEGTYRPSSEEQCGTRSVAATDVLKLPKEERLI
uniref:protein crumbs homolog 3a n=1 Tax=Doryrhamphus excisus TaxID=161450 RepID=UPI0025AEBDE7|nr:protein crumbs homolog 3a [Doryrhamphus excisus]XP_057905365.1 protein crumbs homolog 3a [Doryrhamphus excisus]